MINYPFFHKALCKVRNGIFYLLFAKQILSSVLLAFFFLMGHHISRNGITTLMFERLG